MQEQGSYYERNKELLESFKDGLHIPQYCQYMGRSLAVALLDHVVTKKFLSQSYAIAELRWMGMDKLTAPEHTLGFFNDNRIKIKVWLEHVARRNDNHTAMDYAAKNLTPFSNVGLSGDDLNEVIVLGNKKHKRYQEVADAATKLVAITLAHGFNNFMTESKANQPK